MANAPPQKPWVDIHIGGCISKELQPKLLAKLIQYGHLASKYTNWGFVTPDYLTGMGVLEFDEVLEHGAHLEIHEYLMREVPSCDIYYSGSVERTQQSFHKRGLVTYGFNRDSDGDILVEAPLVLEIVELLQIGSLPWQHSRKEAIEKLKTLCGVDLPPLEPFTLEV